MNAIIVDDEPNSRLALRNILNDYHPHIKIVAEASSCLEAKKVIKNYTADLLFLDIDLPDGYGFDILEDGFPNHVSVIFTTAYSHFALQAFDYAAIHYLLKPINIEQLNTAINRHKILNKNITQEQLNSFKDNISGNKKSIAVQALNKIEVLETSKIIRFESIDGHTFVFINDQKILLNESLNHYEELLVDQNFYRVHAKHIVNLNYINKFIPNGRTGSLQLKDGNNISVSNRKKPAIIKAIKDLG